MGIDFPDRQQFKSGCAQEADLGLDERIDANGKIKGLVGIVERVFVNNQAC